MSIKIEVLLFTFSTKVVPGRIGTCEIVNCPQTPTNQVRSIVIAIVALWSRSSSERAAYFLRTTAITRHKMSQTTQTPNSAIVYYLMEISWFGRTAVKYRLRCLSDRRRCECVCALRASISEECGFAEAAPPPAPSAELRRPAKSCFDLFQ
ncbi:Oidioi.mRNA.OKI2018_I69.PAR.g13002.t1.cds [Oikopleura dioica]|uniref:Oidioi.mRNA.OKI2018_I69.PAR.g13002.t1.cds n=1 Tax=Oikopleura dioica TaxID=34765 RepID=A0ABN7S2Q6_OIKDI|nr:Oidioi.mRNA.OKI2018_I69.PAR.g13002.t1.cds [Oikopleura dioica]